MDSLSQHIFVRNLAVGVNSPGIPSENDMQAFHAPLSAKAQRQPKTPHLVERDIGSPKQPPRPEVHGHQP
jgi:hypothetical protein